MKYRRVTWEDRIRIHLLLHEGKSDVEISRIINKHKSTIGREIKRNSGGRGYRPKQAQTLAEAREALKHCPYKMDAELTAKATELLHKKWSPEQISNRLKYEKRPSASAETIYKFIYKDKKSGGELWRNLRRAHRSRKPRFPSVDRRGTIKDALPISKRSRAANERKRIGDWERDTMLGLDRKTGVLVLTDRKTRFNKFVKLNRKTAIKVTAETIRALKNLPVASITNDRGQEFSDHKTCANKLGVKVYFCDPYTSSQRGTNENRIGILRQYFPKKTDIKKVSAGAIRKVEFEINNRPMKVLDWKTPYEVMMEKSCTRKL
jgi:transposase, IS30 family